VIAGRIEGLGKLGNRSRLTARRPPMGYFKICGAGRTKRQGHGGRQHGCERT